MQKPSKVESNTIKKFEQYLDSVVEKGPSFDRKPALRKFINEMVGEFLREAPGLRAFWRRAALIENTFNIPQTVIAAGYRASY